MAGRSLYLLVCYSICFVFFIIESNAQETTYIFTVKTSCVRWADTDANVYVELIGVNADSNKLHLETSETNTNPFEKGQEDVFTFPNVTSLGELLTLRVWHDNTGSQPGWHLASITVRDLLADRLYTFPRNRWVSYENETKPVRWEFFKNLQMNWTEVLEFCHARKGHMVTPNTSLAMRALEQQTVHWADSTGQNSFPDFWVGLYNPDESNNEVNQLVWEKENRSIDVDHMFWRSERSDFTSLKKERCIRLQQDPESNELVWMDQQCDKCYGVVCEYDQGNCTNEVLHHTLLKGNLTGSVNTYHTDHYSSCQDKPSTPSSTLLTTPSTSPLSEFSTASSPPSTSMNQNTSEIVSTSTKSHVKNSSSTESQTTSFLDTSVTATSETPATSSTESSYTSSTVPQALQSTASSNTSTTVPQALNTTASSNTSSTERQALKSTETSNTSTTVSQALKSTETSNTSTTVPQALQSTETSNTSTTVSQALQSTETSNTSTTVSQALQSTETSNTSTTVPHTLQSTETSHTSTTEPQAPPSTESSNTSSTVLHVTSSYTPSTVPEDVPSSVSPAASPTASSVKSSSVASTGFTQENTPTTQSSIRTTAATQSSVTTTQKRCPCVCRLKGNGSLPSSANKPEDHQQLLVPVKETSKYRRSKTSVYVERNINPGMSVAYIIFMCFLVLCILLCDLTRIRKCRSCDKNRRSRVGQSSVERA